MNAWKSDRLIRQERLASSIELGLHKAPGTHFAGWTLLGVHLAAVELLGPVSKQTIAGDELFAGDVCMPGCMTKEAPAYLALFAFDSVRAKKTLD